MYCAGCFLIPGLLDSTQQSHLFQQALQQYPEPPNTSNLTAHHGHLPSLWDAAQQGLHLKQDHCQPSGKIQADTSHTARSADTPQAVMQNGTPIPFADKAKSADAAHSSQSGGYCIIEGDKTPQAAAQATSEPLNLAPRQPQTPSDAQAQVFSQDTWTSSSSGPTAKSLLQKLRWVALGPQFNWTTREYENHPGVKPLPKSLIALAKAAVTACAEVQDVQDNMQTTADHDRVRNALQLKPSTTATHSSHMVGINACLADMPASRSYDKAHEAKYATHSEYHPDTALVNYYREGDTLGGHKDDAEEHDTMPIVSLSLGCDGVFLIGGKSKDQMPTAMMLHSGDVLVLSGEARQCYHGVPRILPGQCSFDNASHQDDELAACMHNMRINISIRQT